MSVSRNALWGSLLLLPATVLLWVFTYQPILTTLINSFYSTPRGRRPSVFVGADHYARLLADPVFWKAMTNNVIYAAVTIPLSIVLALVMALLVQGSLRGTTAMRMAFFTPTVLPMVAVANVWLFFYAPDYGLIDQVLSLFGLGGNNLLGSRETALWALIAITVWKEAGFFMIFYLAGLQQISPTLLEAANLEGATYWQRLWRVVIPLLMPTTLFIAINAVIGAFRLVDHVVAMTKGGPDNSTMLLLYYLYQVGFGFWDTNYAAAITVVLLALLAVIALFQFGYADKRVHYR
ncbi:carbohydrate ABC transporter permease [Alsobacter sp. R-9]